MQIAKIPKRVVAAIIDLVIVFALSLPLIYFANSEFPFVKGDSYVQEAFYRTRGMLIGFLVDFVYTVFLLGGTAQATLGMKAMRLRLMKENGGSVGLGSSVLRYVVSIFSSLLLKLGYLYAVFNSNNQTVHDYIARTIVADWDEYAVQASSQARISQQQHQQVYEGDRQNFIYSMILFGLFMLLVTQFARM